MTAPERLAADVRGPLAPDGDEVPAALGSRIPGSGIVTPEGQDRAADPPHAPVRGVGLTVRLGGKALLDISFAWGDEGSQSYTTGNTNNAIGFGARAVGTVGLRGVF